MIIALYPHREPCFAQEDQPPLPTTRKKEKKWGEKNNPQCNAYDESLQSGKAVWDKQETFSILKRSPKGSRPSRMVRAKCSFERACLKKWCLVSFSEVGRFFGSFTKHAATSSLKD